MSAVMRVAIYVSQRIRVRVITNFRSFPSWSRSQALSKPVWHIPLLCVLWKTPDDGKRNCPKHVEFYSKNKFEKLVHLIGFIIRIITMHGHLNVKLVGISFPTFRDNLSVPSSGLKNTKIIRNIPEKSSALILHGGSLKSCKLAICATQCLQLLGFHAK